MKQLIETSNESYLESLIGKPVVVWCLNYIYAGTLVGVDDDCLRLTDAKVVYETGPLSGALQDAQSLQGDAFVMRRCVEMLESR